MMNNRCSNAAILAMLIALCCSCSNVTLTTPKQDGEKCLQMLRNSNSLKEIDKAVDVFEKYYSAYENALYNGKITGDQFKDFLMNAPNAAEISNVRAYVTQNGHSPGPMRK